MIPKGFVSTPKVVDKKRVSVFVFWGAFLFFAAVLWFLFLNKPIQVSLEKSFRGHFQFSSIKQEKKKFNFRDFSWHIDFVSDLENLPQSLVSFKTMRIQARKNILGYVSIEKAILQVDTKNHFLKGGVEFAKNLGGWNFNLTNLEINIGSFQKKMGFPAFLSLDDLRQGSLKGIFQYNDLNFNINISKNSKEALLIEFPQQLVKVSKQKIPFGIFADFETTGVWSLASRLEIKDQSIKDSSVLNGTQMLLNMASVQNDFVQSPRGIGILDVNLENGENGLQGEVRADLTKAIFEINDHRYFKNEGLGLIVECRFKNNLISGTTRLGETFADFDFDTKGQLKARFLAMPLQILPKSKNFPLAQNGKLNGNLEAFFVRSLWGSWELERWRVFSKNADISWKGPYEPLPGFKVDGESSYKGSFDFGLDSQKNSHINLIGVWNLSRGQFQFQDYFYKKKGVPFSLQGKYEKKNDLITAFEGTAEGKKNFLKFSLLQQNLFELKFPQVFALAKGSFTGAVSFKLCGESRSQGCLPHVHSYDLHIKDWGYTFPNQDKEFKFSGDVQKGPKEIVYKNLRANLSDDSWMKIDATFSENQSVKDKVNVDAFLNLNTFRDSNLGEFFKILKNKKTDLLLNISSIHKGRNLAFSTDAEFSDKKLKLTNWTLRDEKLQLEGQGEVYLENYILRNEPLSFTASAQAKGELGSLEFLSTKAPFDGKAFLASSGFTVSDWLEKMEARFHGKISFENIAITRLLDEIFTSYASETKNSFSQSLQSCVPEKIKGKVDLSYNKGHWDLSQSLFKDQDKESMLKLEGPLRDFRAIELQAHYLPGSQCSPILSSCLGELLPKGGIALDLKGSLKDPETDFDFKSMTEVLDKCAKKDEARKLASKPKLKAEDQARRLRSLKNFYQSR